MSAIAGVLNLNFDADILQNMLSTMRRRGCEGEGSYKWRQMCLLHTEHFAEKFLNAQPLILDHGTECYVMTFDGVLYNPDELRSELEHLGHHWEGQSHAEIMLHAYAQWKEETLNKVNGVFALAILEEHTGRVFLARDRIGVKPLFYMLHQGGLLFASEMKTILAYPNVPRELDVEGAAQLLLLGPGRKMGSGVFHNMLELKPGHCATYEKGKLSVKRYWKLMDREHTEDFNQTGEHVRWLVLDAIHRQMVAEKPIGTFLSGGLDSSLISAVCARELEAKGDRLHTFSVDYLDNERYFQPGKFQPNADAEYIRLMQSHLDTDHHWTILSTEDLLNGIEEAMIARDLPGMADVDVSLLAFCRRVKPHARVVLSGECADEIFGGYPWYRAFNLEDSTFFPWAKNTNQRESLLHPDIRRKIHGVSYIHDEITQTLLDCDILPDSTEKGKKQMMNLNLWWFMQTLIDRNDRMSSCCGLEVRVPFCDYRIVEYLYGVPWAFMDHKGREKGLLRHAVRDILPDAILFRKKSPYPKTHHPDYAEAVIKRLEAVLEDAQAPLFALIDRSAVLRMLEGNFTTPWYGQLMQLPQTIVYLLQINAWMKNYSVQIR